MATTLTEYATFCKENGWRHLTTDGLAQLTFFINDTFQQLAAEFCWPFLRKTHYFNLTVPYTTGTVELTEASTTVTGSGTANFSSGMANQLFYCASDSGRVYQITAVGASAETLTLGSAYLGEDESGAEYAIRYVHYALPTGFAKAGAMMLEDEREISTDLTLQDWHKKITANRGTSSSPTECCIETESGTAGLFMYPAPSAAKQVRLVYYIEPTTLTSVVTTNEWPDSLRWLVFYVLRHRIAHDMADVAFMLASDREFERMLSRAIVRSRPTQVPLLVSRADPRAMTPEELRGLVTIVQEE